MSNEQTPEAVAEVAYHDGNWACAHEDGPCRTCIELAFANAIRTERSVSDSLRAKLAAQTADYAEVMAQYEKERAADRYVAGRAMLERDRLRRGLNTRNEEVGELRAKLAAAEARAEAFEAKESTYVDLALKLDTERQASESLAAELRRTIERASVQHPCIVIAQSKRGLDCAGEGIGPCWVCELKQALSLTPTTALAKHKAREEERLAWRAWFSGAKRVAIHDEQELALMQVVYDARAAVDAMEKTK